MDIKKLSLEELQAEFAKQEAAFEEFKKQAEKDGKDALQKEQAAADTIKQKDLDKKAVDKELEQVKKVNAGLTKKLEDLSKTKPAVEGKKVAETSAKLEDLEFTKDGVRYGFNWPVQTIAKVRVHASDVVKDADLQLKLIETSSPWLRKK